MRNVSKVINGKRVIIKKPELLAPAGNLEKLKIAIDYGADAVYFGGEAFSLRAAAQNFTFEEIKEGAELAHSLGKKIYCTVNVMPRNEGIEKLPEFLKSLEEAKVDAVLVRLDEKYVHTVVPSI